MFFQTILLSFRIQNYRIQLNGLSFIFAITMIQPSSFTLKLSQLQHKLFFDLYGTIRFPLYYQVNFFKGATFLYVLFLIVYFQNYSHEMLLYLAIHGTYGLCWLFKHHYFPDERALLTASIGSQLCLFVLLFSYWMIPLPLAAGYGSKNIGFLSLITIGVIYLVGLTLMMGADYQKHSRLAIKKGLISDGFFTLTRNPNYLGEFLIYSSFVICSGHMLGYLVFYGAGGALFALNIHLKQELSYKNKTGYVQYCKHSYIFFPKIFKRHFHNIVFYSIIISLTLLWLANISSSTFFYPLDLVLTQL